MTEPDTSYKYKIESALQGKSGEVGACGGGNACPKGEWSPGGKL